MPAKKTKLIQSNKWYEIFEAGEHTDSSGDTKYWSEEDLLEIASKTNASKSDVPLVIGHPQSNSPAWGWTKKNFKVENGKLLAQFRDVIPPFAEAVTNKQYPKVSVSIRSNGTLRHVGFLGGVPPAVPGLEEVEFASEEDDLIYECNFNEYNDGGNDMPASVKEQTVDPRDKKIQDLEAAVSQFMEQQNQKDKEIAELKTQAATSEFAEKARQREEEVAQLKAQLQKVEKEKRDAEYKSFCEGLKEYITPADKPFVMGMLEICHGTGKYEFAEGSQEDSMEKFKDFLKRNLKQQVDFKEVASKDKAAGKDSSSKTSEFSELENVDKSQLELDGKVKDYMEKHDVTYAAALQKVRSK